MDAVAVGSDAGTLAVLCWNPESQRFEQATGVKFEKPGCLRSVPGQWVAADSNGRVVVIGTSHYHESFECVD